jgi:glucose/arabinose dehydrogenase
LALRGYPMHKKSISLLALILMMLFAQSLATTLVRADDASDVLTLVNQARAAQGVAAVTLCAPLTQAAAAHSTDMATRNFFDHNAPPPNASDPGQRITQAGYNWTTYGENIALGQTTPQEVFDSWMSSSGHRDNILNPAFVHMGLGTATGSAGKYWTQVFAAGGSCGSGGGSASTATRFVEAVPGSPFSQPLYVTHAGDNRLFVVERGGRIRIVQNGAVLNTPFLNVSSLVTTGGSEQGLLGLAFHPGYPQNGLFYINYTNTSGDTVVAQYRVMSNDPNRADPNSATQVLLVDQPFVNHNGGQMAFGPDGLLYIGMGDGGSGGDPQNYAQNTQSLPGNRLLLGKMVRINVNQQPFTPQVFALGLRNPWRWSFDRATNDMYIGDVGQNAWEEISFLPAGSAPGANFGWKIYEGTHQFSSGSLTGDIKPFAEYDHGQGCSVTGGYVYRGAQIPGLQGKYLFGDFCSGRLWISTHSGSGQWTTSVYKDTNYSISSFGEDLAGEMYLVDYSGSLLKFAPEQAPTNTPIPTNTPVPPTSTPLPTHTPIPPTSSPLPTNTPIPPSMTPEPTLVEPSSTPLPTDIPPTETELPPSPTAPPSGPTLKVDVVPDSANAGEMVNVMLNLLSVSNLYGLQLECAVDPAVLTGGDLTETEAFNSGNSFIVNSGYQDAGHWLVAATRLQPNPAIDGDALAFNLSYTVQSSGQSNVTCEALAVDQDGRDVALTVINGGFNGVSTEPTVTPEPTATPTNTPLPTMTFTPIPPGGLSSIHGTVFYQARADQSGIVVDLWRSDGTHMGEVITGPDGSYTFSNIPIAQYGVVAWGAQHLTSGRVVNVLIEGQTIEADNIILHAGDTDGNQIIDLADAAYVGANIGNTQPPAPYQADLNRDGKVDIRDLVLVGGNFGLQGPVIEP